MRQKKILALVHDPGSCMMLLPVFVRLQNEFKENLILYASSIVAPSLRKQGVLFEQVTEDVSEEKILDWIRRSAPDVILTGTSWGSQIEQRIRNNARHLNIKSVVALDYWANYRLRWEGLDHPLEKIQDEICVVDEIMKYEMHNEGFPLKQVHVTGHPYLEYLSKTGITRKTKSSSFHKILFLSEPILELNLIDRHQLAFDLIMESLQAAAVTKKSTYNIDFKFHPKEEQRLPVSWNQERWDRLSLQIVNSEIQNSLRYENYDLVVGYHTMGLLEAALSGLPVISVPVRNLSKGVFTAFSKAGIFVVSFKESRKIIDIEKWMDSFQPPSDSQYEGARVSFYNKVAL